MRNEKGLFWFGLLKIFSNFLDFEINFEIVLIQYAYRHKVSVFSQTLLYKHGQSMSCAELPKAVLYFFIC